ncbi:MAG: hypothetical protein ACOYUZ_01240 [Patescibacteria group bacterium]
MTLRTEATNQRYQKFLQNKPADYCFLCKAEPIKEFTYWKIVENEYPYDKVLSAHHMVTLKRHVNEEGMTAAEIAEFTIIKKLMHMEHDMIFENAHKKKSIPDHHHLHMGNLKNSDEQERICYRHTSYVPIVPRIWMAMLNKTPS